MDVSGLARKYIELRDLVSEQERIHKESIEPYKRAMDKIERALLMHMNGVGAESVRTEFGTVYKTTKTSVTTADGELFMDYVIKNNAFELLDRRPNKTAVVSFRNERNDLPPGVNWREEVTVNIRRS